MTNVTRFSRSSKLYFRDSKVRFVGSSTRSTTIGAKLLKIFGKLKQILKSYVGLAAVKTTSE